MQQQPNKKKMLWIFGIIFAVMILLGNSVLVALVTYSIVHEQSSAKTGTFRDGNLKLSGEEADVANVVAKVSPTVVSIITAQGSYTGVKQAAGTNRCSGAVLFRGQRGHYEIGRASCRERV